MINNNIYQLFNENKFTIPIFKIDNKLLYICSELHYLLIKYIYLYIYYKYD